MLNRWNMLNRNEPCGGICRGKRGGWSQQLTPHSTTTPENVAMWYSYRKVLRSERTSRDPSGKYGSKRRTFYNIGTNLGKGGRGRGKV